MNRNGDRPYTDHTLRSLLTELAARLDVRDSTGALVDFNRTHRFRHTVATNLLNTGVPLHVLQRYLGHLTPTMSMTYAQTLQSTAEREFLRYRKITADARDLEIDPHDLYDMLALDRRTDRILPNGWCLLPPRQSCNKGNACLTCDKFATDATFLPELRTQRARTGQLIDERRTTFEARTGQPMSEDNIWLAGRRQEHDALGRVILTLEHTRLADGTVQALRGAGVDRPHRCHHRRTEPEVTGMRGNPDNLRRAAARKSAAAQARAEHGLREMIRANEQITFRGLAQTAGVSLDFLYRCAPIRQRVEHLRAQQQNTPPPEGDHDPRGRSEQRRPHPHLAAQRAQATTPGRGPRSQTGTRSRPRRDPRTTSPPRLPSSPRRHHDTLTLHLQTRTQTIYLRKHTNSRSLPQIRRRHKRHYADLRIMPMCAADPGAGQAVFVAGEVGIIRALRGRRAGCRVGGSGRCGCWVVAVRASARSLRARSACR